MDWEEITKWVIGGVVVIAIAWAPVACTRSVNDKIEAAVQAGVDPQLAACAYGTGNGSSTSCIVAQSRNTK